jgi:hypothetical protein
MSQMEVAPFAFRGHPDLPVFIHSNCGTVLDAVPGSDTWVEIEQGNCDCETSGPWHRVYVAEDGS